MTTKKIATWIAVLAVLSCICVALVACESHEHQYKWVTNYEYHWKEATCEHTEEKTEPERHSFDDNGVCTVCDYVKPPVDPNADFTITYDANNGVFPDDAQNPMTVTAKGNSLLTQPDQPTRAGYTFAGWARHVNGTAVWDFATDRVSGDVTLYAVWLRIYTATFDTNGGEFEDGTDQLAVEATKGDLLTIPDQPEREGYEFLGWFKDSNLREEWDFTTDTISGNVILYAGWEFIIVEHNVTFNLNYEGAEDVVMSTEKGLVTYVPTREGYVFNGWWIGRVSNDGIVLQEKWDNSTIVTSDSFTLYAEWIEESLTYTKLSTPSVAVTDGVFSWQAVEGAVGYEVHVFKGSSTSGDELVSDVITRTSWTIPGGYETGYYLFRVRAIGDGRNTVNSSYAQVTYAHYILPAVTGISLDSATSRLTWNTVKNATSYQVYINGELVDTVYYASFDMSDYDAGSYSVKIVPVARDYEATSASTTTITKIRLRTPELKVTVDKQKSQYVLTWDSVYHADAYILNFNGEEVKVEGKTSYTFANSASIWGEEDTVTLTLAALDSGADWLISIVTEEITIGKLFTLTVTSDTEDAGEISVKGQVFVQPTFRVTYDGNGYSYNGSVTVSASKALEYPGILTRTGYVFTGWYTDKNCKELYDFTAEVTRDITLYAGWYKITTDGYATDVIDIRTRYNSSSSTYSFSTSNLTSSNSRYTYFTALTSGTYTLYYRNGSSTSSYATVMTVYNATKSKYIRSSTSSITSTSYTALEMELEAGDVVYIRNYMYSSYSSTFYFYITGGKTPAASGYGSSNLIKGAANTTSTDSKIIADVGTELTITAKAKRGFTFDGWYVGDEKVSDELTYTFTMTAANVIFTAKWIEE